MQIELVLLIVAVLFFVSILSGRISSKLGIPALLLFLSVGMIFGKDGVGIQFENIQAAQAIGTVALSIILFSGGLDTKFEEIRPIVKQGVVLATVGVLVMALFSGILSWWVLNKTLPTVTISLTTALLLAST
ncbi:MAG TPA: cation:proton antiporter, partial [Salinivirgaceae bacterium]|nr:cation:proton antiporter [Salinivirgaceae bacterium]